MADTSGDVWEDSRAMPLPAQQHGDDREVQDDLLGMSMPRRVSELQQDPMSRERFEHVLSTLRTLDGRNGAAQDLQSLVSAYTQWIRESTQAVDDSLWFQLAEMSSWLAIHLGDASLSAQFSSTELRATSMPTKDSFCDQQRQIAFTVRLFDALCGPVAGGAAKNEASVVNGALQVFLSWMSTAMRDVEFVFVTNIGHDLIHHIRQKYRELPTAIARSTHAYIEVASKDWAKNASKLAVATLLISSSSQTAILRQQEALIVSILSETKFPHIHEPAAVIAAAFSSSPVTALSSALVQQFTTLRIATLPLVSPRLVMTREAIDRLLQRHSHVLERSQVDERLMTQCLEMINACKEEIRHSLSTNPALRSSILSAMQSRSESPLFRNPPIADESEFSVELFISAFYDIACATIQRFTAVSPSSTIVLQCFKSLVQLEFARECCPSPARNDLIVRLTQCVEDLADTAPDATLGSLAATVHSEKTLANDIVFGWTCLAVGQTIQRKLRTVLFHASDTVRRDALAVVFAGLYHDLEPLSDFASRFLSFTLASLGQFVSVYEVFPFYLQETLRLYPSVVTNEQAASAIGTIFGALYYTQAVASSEKEPDNRVASETRKTMILWALRQCRTRVLKLLPAEGTAVDRSSGLYLAELFLELAKMAPIELLPSVAVEMEALVANAAVKQDAALLREVKARVFNAVSVNCEAEKRAWLAAWFLELAQAYPTAPEPSQDDTVAASEPPPVARL